MTQMTFADMKMRTDYIGGEIKQADADVCEAVLMRERAERALEQAMEFERKAIERAVEKREERSNLADAMATYIMAQGEAPIAEVVGLDHETFEVPVSDVPAEGVDSVGGSIEHIVTRSEYDMLPPAVPARAVSFSDPND